MKLKHLKCKELCSNFRSSSYLSPFIVNPRVLQNTTFSVSIVHSNASERKVQLNGHIIEKMANVNDTMLK